MATTLIGYDGSDGARRAIETAAAFLAGGRVVVVTAFEDWPPAHAGDKPHVDADARARTEATAAEGAAIARAAGLDAEPRAVFVPGAAWRALLAVAEEEAAGLIVVGSHGFRGLRPLVLGSVSHQLAHHASQPVLTVPTPAAVEARRAHAGAAA